MVSETPDLTYVNVPKLYFHGNLHFDIRFSCVQNVLYTNLKTQERDDLIEELELSLKNVFFSSPSGSDGSEFSKDEGVNTSPSFQYIFTPPSKSVPRATSLGDAYESARVEYIKQERPHVDPSTTRPRGKFIVLEGTDNSGKSTQQTLITDFFKLLKLPVISITFPDRTTKLGKILDQFLKKQKEIGAYDLHIIFSLNRWELTKKIYFLLSMGVTVICDRYSYSGLVYTDATNKFPFSQLMAFELGMIKPDAVFQMMTPLSVCATRKGYGEEAFETLAIQKKVLAGFERYHKNPEWYCVDGTRHPDLIARTLVYYIMIKIVVSDSCIDIIRKEDLAGGKSSTPTCIDCLDFIDETTNDLLPKFFEELKEAVEIHGRRDV